MATERKCNKEAEIAFLQAKHSTMAEDIKDIKDTQVRIFDKIEELKNFFLDGINAHQKYADGKYATKDEHRENAEKILEVQKSQRQSLVAIISILGSIAIALIGVIWANIDKFA